MRRTPTPPTAQDFVVSAQYRYGILRFTVALDADTKPVWLHAVGIDLTAEDGSTEAFSFPINSPIRMNPGGRTRDHWRPRTIDLEDGSQARPGITVTIAAARKRQQPVRVSPGLEIDDGFERVNGTYRLIASSEFAQEIERNKRRRMDGLATRET